MKRGFALRRAVPFTALVFAVLVTTALVLNVVGTTSIARDIARNADVVAREDSLADALVTAADAQRLAALHYVRTPNDELIREFDARGRETYDILRQYLFLPMPLGSRVQVEEIKEVHERFEVATQLTFGQVSRRDRAGVRVHADTVAASAREMAAAVQRFVETRRRQHEAFRSGLDASLASYRRGSIVIAVAVLVIALLLAHVLRFMVLQPLLDLDTAAARLGAGETGARVTTTPRFREFAIVADTFNHMADRIDQSRLLVEQKNEALTAALNDLRNTQTELVQREKLSAMGEMLAGLAHELNNPLAAVMAGAESLQSELLDLRDPRARRLTEELATPLVAAASRARDLVRNLLRFSRQSEGQCGPVDLAQAVVVAVGLRKHAFRQGGLHIATDVAEGTFVVGDSQKLEHIFLNLLGNALDALSSGGGSGTWIRSRFDGPDWVEVVVEDDGPGFQDPKRAFQPFYTTKAVGKGTGLGLAIVHRFVDECGGSIRIENRPDGGARVVLRLRSMAPMALHVPVRQSEPVDSVPAIAGQPTVLVVEDELPLRRLHAHMLRKLGVDILLAETGADACEVLRVREVDLVISDLRMPGGMSGLDLLKWMRAERPALAATALVVTGDLETTALESQGIDLDRVIAKPFKRDEYLARVARALAVGSRAP